MSLYTLITLALVAIFAGYLLRRYVRLGFAWAGIAATHFWHPRAVVHSVRFRGWRGHGALMASFVRLMMSLGAREAVKLARLIGAIGLELCPDPHLVDEMLRVAVAGSGMGLKARQILPVLHRMARKAAAWHPSGAPVHG